MKKLTTRSVDKRIYVVASQKSLLPGRDPFILPPGMIAAQVGHAVSKLRYAMLRHDIKRVLATKASASAKLKQIDTILGLNDGVMKPITTIVLGARDNKEVDHVFKLLVKANVFTVRFFDTNPVIYDEHRVLTAIATEPVYPDKLDGITDYLPLWDVIEIAPLSRWMQKSIFKPERD
jgi:hypothetical protein